MLNKIVNGELVEMSAEEEAAIRAEWAASDAAKAEYETTVAYKDKRRNAYPSIGDQLDSIYKTLLHLQTNNIDIGPDGDALIDQITAVKETYPKP